VVLAGFFGVFLAGSISAAAYGAAESLPPEEKTASPAPGPSAMVDLIVAMRKLWKDQVTWTRVFILSSLARMADTGTIAGKLLQNQEDIGRALKPFYGDDCAEKMASLLKAHIGLASEFVASASSANGVGLAEVRARWKANASEIARFLAAANPHWMPEALAGMLHKHLDYTMQEVLSRLRKDWARDIAAFDKGQNQILLFADELSKGIILQFPERFGK
jgi:hypothetical protein